MKQTVDRSQLRSRLWLIAGLMVLSTILFVAGVAVERGWAAAATGAPTHSTADQAREQGEQHATTEAPGAHQEAGEEGEANEATEAPGAHQEAGETPGAEGHDETVLGLNFENPWFVGAFALGSLLLAGALLWFGPRVLLLVVLVAGGAALLDLREVWLQLARANTTVAVIASTVAITHIAAAVLAILTWRAYRTTPSHPTDSARSTAA